ncbi:hypothetical protein LZ554_001659 [Drepanopeziza brunnea f. sp. 'monogermtubi']|nr:hypothetical protein LZ554_001659 [Drepanopeziza brunnea f. sp. 'monogermtubi']
MAPKGCAKCGVPADHKASQCKRADYQPYDQQTCDQCFQEGHEYEQCTDHINPPCRACGHGDHQSNPNKSCPLTKNVPYAELPDAKINQFTPSYRAKALAAIEASKNLQSPNAKSPPKSPPTGSLSRNLSLRPKSASKSISSPSQGSPRQTAPAKQVEEDDPKLAQLKSWASAEKSMPSKRSTAKNSEGKNADILANFFEIKLETPRLQQYSITIEEERLSGDSYGDEDGLGPDFKRKRRVKKETKRFLIQNYLSKNKPAHGNWATDWDSTIISVGSLYPPEKLGVLIEPPAAPPNPHKSNKPPRVPPPRLLTSVSLVGQVDIAGLKDHVGGDGKKSMENPGEVLKALNIISWKDVTNPDTTNLVGRAGNKFYPASQEAEGRKSVERREIYFLRHGFFSSMRPGQDSVLLNVNTVTTAFLSPRNLQNWMELAWPGYTPGNGLFKAKLKDVRVKLLLHGANSRLWVIHNLIPKRVSQTLFKQKDGTDVGLATYLQRQYPKTYHASAANQNSFVINVGGVNNEILYPANQLMIVDWQVAKESVEEASGISMVTAATKKPQQNMELILAEGLKVLGLKPLQSFYKSFGMVPSPKMINMQVPLLPSPRIKMADQKGDNFKHPETIKGEWRITGQKFYQKAVQCQKLCVMSFIDRDEALPGVSALKADLSNYGITGKEPAIVWSDQRMVDLDGPRNTGTDYRSRCEDIFRSAAAEFGSPRPTIILVVLEEKNIKFYQEVKRWGDCVVGIPTVCVTAFKLGKVTADPKLRANICLKMNFKLKGVSHKIEPTGQRAFKPKGMTGANPRTMIMGADVTHPSKGLEDCPSMAGVVATNDDGSSCYLASARLQKGRQEYIQDLQGMVEERVMAWVDKAKEDRLLRDTAQVLPSEILFYRDGVSEIQYGMVLHEEKPQIFQGCKNALARLMKGPRPSVPASAKNWVPKLTLIVVTKRHHARFYPEKKVSAGSKEDVNVACGMVVDNKVVTPNQWSFYLQSHTSELGTARTAYYVVLYDDAGQEPVALQKITNNICYTSARATRAVSVCTPARYADILCDRLRCYMKPVLDMSYEITAPPTAPPAAPPSSSSMNFTAATSSPETLENTPSYVRHARVDPYVWNRDATDGRINPWPKSLDNCMFYL